MTTDKAVASTHTADSEEVTIDVRGVSKGFGQFKAVQNLSFKVSKGEVVGFLGPNGAGKTTLISMISGHIKPTLGNVFFQNKLINNLSLSTTSS